MSSVVPTRLVWCCLMGILEPVGDERQCALYLRKARGYFFLNARATPEPHAPRALQASVRGCERGCIWEVGTYG